MASWNFSTQTHGMWEKDKKMKVTKEKQVNLPEDHPPQIVGNPELPLIIYRIYKILFFQNIKDIFS